MTTQLPAPPANHTPVEHVALGNWHMMRAERWTNTPAEVAKLTAFAQAHFLAATAKATGEAIYGEDFMPDVTAATKDWHEKVETSRRRAYGLDV